MTVVQHWLSLKGFLKCAQTPLAANFPPSPLDPHPAREQMWARGCNWDQRDLWMARGMSPVGATSAQQQQEPLPGGHTFPQVGNPAHGIAQPPSVPPPQSSAINGQ